MNCIAMSGGFHGGGEGGTDCLGLLLQLGGVLAGKMWGVAVR